MKTETLLEGVTFARNLTRAQYVRNVELLIKAAGYKPIAAIYDAAGNCKACGESGRCPGFHLAEEMPEMPADGFYKLIRPPANMRQGLINAVSMAANALADGNTDECAYQLSDIINDLASNANPYELKGSIK